MLWHLLAAGWLMLAACGGVRVVCDGHDHVGPVHAGLVDVEDGALGLDPLPRAVQHDAARQLSLAQHDAAQEQEQRAPTSPLRAAPPAGAAVRAGSSVMATTTSAAGARLRERRAGRGSS